MIKVIHRQRISECCPSVGQATKPRATLEFTYECTGFGFAGFRRPDAGLFRVTMNDLPPLDATFFDSFSHPGRVRHKAWFYPGELPQGRLEFLGKLPDHEAILKRAAKKDIKPDAPPAAVLQVAAILLAGSLTP